ncbi:MAG: hypothetical protein CVV50_04130 [Spirochaetae bacterium HGW-Spirochaetae-6]|nr:MAG: hypothetical protein CVV50_04130 [Spirochaetae bacterium HGW-Spirochaetae-6]
MTKFNFIFLITMIFCIKLHTQQYNTYNLEREHIFDIGTSENELSNFKGSLGYSGPTGPMGLSFKDNGTLLINDTMNYKIKVFNQAYDVIEVIDTPFNEYDTLNATYIEIDKQSINGYWYDEFYIQLSSSGEIQKRLRLPGLPFYNEITNCMIKGEVSFFWKKDGSLFSIPLSLFLGIIPGLAIGFLLIWFFKKFQEKIRATEKTLLILGISLLLIEVGEWLHAATLLGVMSLGFVLLEKHPPAANQLSVKLNKAWVFAEIVLFVLIGMAVDIPVAIKAGASGILLIGIGLLFRSLGVFMALAFSRLNLREKLFCMIAYLPKATVQAALGAVPLSAGIQAGPTILAVAVLSIILTAPLGLFGIKYFGPRLLKVDFESKNPLEDNENFAQAQ